MEKPTQGMACCQGAVRHPVRRPICVDGLNYEERLNTQKFLQDLLVSEKYLVCKRLYCLFQNICSY